VMRGGTWNRDATRCRSASRDSIHVSDLFRVGFRPAMTIEP